MSRAVTSVPMGFDEGDEEFTPMDWGRTAYDEATPRFHASVCCTPPRDHRMHVTPQKETMDPAKKEPSSRNNIMETPPSNRKSSAWIAADDNNTNMWFKSPARDDSVARTPVTTPLREVMRNEKSPYSGPSTGTRGSCSTPLRGTPLRNSVMQQLTPKGPSELPRACESSDEEEEYEDERADNSMMNISNSYSRIAVVNTHTQNESAQSKQVKENDRCLKHDLNSKEVGTEPYGKEVERTSTQSQTSELTSNAHHYAYPGQSAQFADSKSEEQRMKNLHAATAASSRHHHEKEKEEDENSYSDFEEDELNTYYSDERQSTSRQATAQTQDSSSRTQSSKSSRSKGIDSVYSHASIVSTNNDEALEMAIDIGISKPQIDMSPAEAKNAPAMSPLLQGGTVVPKRLFDDYDKEATETACLQSDSQYAREGYDEDAFGGGEYDGVASLHSQQEPRVESSSARTGTGTGSNRRNSGSSYDDYESKHESKYDRGDEYKQLCSNTSLSTAQQEAKQGHSVIRQEFKSGPTTSLQDFQSCSQHEKSIHESSTIFKEGEKQVESSISKQPESEWLHTDLNHSVSLVNNRSNSNADSGLGEFGNTWVSLEISNNEDNIEQDKGKNQKPSSVTNLQTPSQNPIMSSKATDQISTTNVVDIATPQQQSHAKSSHQEVTPKTASDYMVNGDNVTLGDEWKSTTDTKGRRYFYNRRTRETAWQPPQGLMKILVSPGQFRLFTPVRERQSVAAPKTMPNQPSTRLSGHENTPNDGRKQGSQTSLIQKKVPMSEGGVGIEYQRKESGPSQDMANRDKQSKTSQRESKSRGAWSETQESKTSQPNRQGVVSNISTTTNHPITNHHRAPLVTSSRPPGMSNDSSNTSHSSKEDVFEGEEAVNHVNSNSSTTMKNKQGRSLAGLKQALNSQTRQAPTPKLNSMNQAFKHDDGNYDVSSRASFDTRTSVESQREVIDLTPTPTKSRNLVEDLGSFNGGQTGSGKDVSSNTILPLFCPFCRASTSTTEVAEHINQCELAQTMNYVSVQCVLNAVSVLKAKLHDSMAVGEMNTKNDLLRSSEGIVNKGTHNVEVENVLTLDNGKFGCCLCKRTFGNKRSALSHSRACRTVFSEKRSTFDAATKRVKGTPLEFIETYQKSPLLHGGNILEEDLDSANHHQHGHFESPTRANRPRDKGRGTPPRHPHHQTPTTSSSHAYSTTTTNSSSGVSHTKQHTPSSSSSQVTHHQQPHKKPSQSDRTSIRHVSGHNQQHSVKPLQVHPASKAVTHTANTNNIQSSQKDIHHHDQASSRKADVRHSALPEVKGALQA